MKEKGLMNTSDSERGQVPAPPINQALPAFVILQFLYLGDD